MSNFFLVGMAVLIAVILFMLVTNRRPCPDGENFSQIFWPWQTPPKHDLGYLQQYEEQDRYKNNPGIWPVIDNAATADFALQRKENELRALR